MKILTNYETLVASKYTLRPGDAYIYEMNDKLQRLYDILLCCEIVYANFYKKDP